MLRTYRQLTVMFVVFGCGLISAGQARATSFTWSGGTPDRAESMAHWSAPTNWAGGFAPVPSEVLGTLTFPYLTNSECTSTPRTDTCYLTLNDVKGLTVNEMLLDDADNYVLSGEKITLGSGGIVAESLSRGMRPAGAFVEMPLELSAPQKWNIAERGTSQIEESGLVIGGEVTGLGQALTAELSNGPALVFDNSAEVGPVTFEGPDREGEHIDNGSVLLEEGELNSTNDEPVTLRNIFFRGTGAVGGLLTDNATVDVGDSAYPAGSLRASSITLDPTSDMLFEINGEKVEAGKDYSYLVSTGAVELTGQVGVVVDEPSVKAGCPVLRRGQTYTFISTTAPLSGVFSNAPEPSFEELPIYFANSCGQRSQTMRIAYSRTGSLHTVTGTVEAEAAEKETEFERSVESADEEAERFAKQTEVERQAEKRREEEAIAERNRKYQEEDAVGIARRQREEEAEAETAADGFEVSLDGSTIEVPKSGTSAVKLRCGGIRTCVGKLTLAVKHREGHGSKIIGAATYSIKGGVTMTIKLALNATGRALIRTEHGPLRATLNILQTSPGPRRTHSQGVLVLRRHEIS